MRETGPSPLKKTAYRGPLVGNWLVTQRRVIGVQRTRRRRVARKLQVLGTVVIWTYFCGFTSRCVRKVLWRGNGFDLRVILTVNRGVWRSLHTRCEMNKRPVKMWNVRVQEVQNSARPWDSRSCVDVVIVANVPFRTAVVLKSRGKKSIDLRECNHAVLIFFLCKWFSM